MKTQIKITDITNYTPVTLPVDVSKATRHVSYFRPDNGRFSLVWKKSNKVNLFKILLNKN
jgi:hypothetical protein